MSLRIPSLAFVLALPLAAQTRVPETTDPRTRARAAVGELRTPGALLEGHGTARVSGAEGELTLLLSPAGPFRLQLDSALPEHSGFDGRTAWLRDHTGLGRPVELEDADLRKLVYWILSGHWLEAGELEVGSAAGDESALRLRLEGSPLEATLALDADSGLPAELVVEGDSGPMRWDFGDYREVDGRRLAHRWTANVGGLEDVYRIERFAPAANGDAAFRPELSLPADARFDPEAEPELAVTRMTSGHLLVEPLLEGESFGAFVFDTGASITVIDRRVADELMLETLGTTVATGVAASTTSSFRRGESFRLGPLTIESPVYGDIDLGFAQGGSPRIAGIVGYDVLARCVVEFEAGTPRIALRDPDGYELAGGRWQDLTLHANNPCVRAHYEGEREGLFRLDTGSTDTVTFHAPTVRRLDLLSGRELIPNRSGGVGGSAPAPEGVLKWFELAGHRFELPRVGFSQATSGTFTDLYTDGNIGQAFLRPFRIVLDYRNDRIAFVEL